ncbi:MAG: ABC transporter ATP-binding protein [Janthinobacterium lividum]
MTDSLLTIDSITTYYGRSQALFGVSLDVRPGQCIALLGRNGMGRSTTVKSVMGITPAKTGTIRFNGQTITALPSHAIARMGIGLVPEGRRIFATLTVAENLLSTARPPKKDAVENWTLERVYSMFPRLRERCRQLGKTLSGGEQQMLAIGRALMTNPSLLILDEATEGLAPIVCKEIWTTLSTLRQAGLAMITIDKNVSALLPLSDRLYVLEKGTVAWEGDSQAFRLAESQLQPYLGI